MSTKVKDDQLNESYIKSDGTRPFSGNQSMNNNRLTNVAAPVNDNDAARKIDLISGPQIINSGTAVLDEITRTYTFEDWIWKFYGPNLEPAPFTTDEIPEEDEGFSKVYHVLGNQAGEFVINSGDSSDELLIDPSPIPGTLYLTRFVVSGSVIGEPEAPILGSEFVKKAYSNRLNLFPPLDGIYELPSDGRTSFNFVAGGFTVKGFSIPSGHEHLHEGKLFYFKNSSDDPITFEHAEAAVVNYNLPDGENLIIEPAVDKVLMFKFSFLEGLTLLNQPLKKQYIFVTSSRALLNSDHGKTLKVGADITLTIPASGLRDDFEVFTDVFETFELNWALGSGVTVSGNSGLVQEENTQSLLYKLGSSNAYRLIGQV